MIYTPSMTAVVVFFLFVGFTVGLSFYLGRKATSSAGYFAAHGQIPWFINGVAFAGDYLSAASFLGICGMIAAYGYDGFLYSIGYLAGWIVALFVIAEPMKRLGKFTFADALDAKFNSPGIKAAAGISTLIVSVFYLIPQMVGAGVLIQPLLGFPHWVGVVLVGCVVITIVVTAGMVSTTWVQFLKGSLLVLFSTVLVTLVLQQGFHTDRNAFATIGPLQIDSHAGDDAAIDPQLLATAAGRTLYTTGAGETASSAWDTASDFIRFASDDDEGYDIFRIEHDADGVVLREAQAETVAADGSRFVGGLPLGAGAGERTLRPVGQLTRLPEEFAADKTNDQGGRGEEHTGPLGPIQFFDVLRRSEVTLWGNQTITHQDGAVTKVYYQKPTPGSQVLRPGEHPTFAGIRSGRWTDRINFLSLMLALFCGTASLPHILIRYYTVKDAAAARKSTIVGIASIGFFYVLTLYLGLGAMTSGTLDVTNSNMAAPLLARGISDLLFAIISAIAFTTVLGTVSGLILASSGAVAHDLLGGVMGIQFAEGNQVRVAKIAAVVVGAIAIVLGILFQNLNVSYLVGWAFSIAASANLPALVMLLFWRRTTAAGIIASVVVGMFSSLGWILLSADTFSKVYKIDPADSPIPFSQPGIVTIPLALLTLVIVSLMTQNSPPKMDSVAESGAKTA
ncbi:cation acetate symporter [Allorhodopirellula heiligendammensis]|uniref:Cation/acetate symporter ActP n=1 Tax=Allorhodopirellula heiligendammensis TaxID=2714739 RepID=A0A5C6BTK1_9BACT|nr:cation acetate symporter [Allorhodopirellula heiligendammensis]TWU15550.1 Cation/acetate symporter ActP [Allorhodopirellula heiligendammensis]